MRLTDCEQYTNVLQLKLYNSPWLFLWGSSQMWQSEPLTDRITLQTFWYMLRFRLVSWLLFNYNEKDTNDHKYHPLSAHHYNNVCRYKTRDKDLSRTCLAALRLSRLVSFHSSTWTSCLRRLSPALRWALNIYILGLIWCRISNGAWDVIWRSSFVYLTLSLPISMQKIK